MRGKSDNMQEQQDRRLSFAGALVSAGILLAAMLVSIVLASTAYRSTATEDVDNPMTAQEWMVRAGRLVEAEEYEQAELACRAALAYQPGHPGAARKLTLLLLRKGDIEAIRDWMDDLVLGDARLTERLFQLPEFEPYMDDPDLQALYREAQIQARD